jgi:hypothetical protein
MSGTWLQSGSYGPVEGYRPIVTGRNGGDLVATIAALPAVTAARRRCAFVVATALFLPRPGFLMPPASHDMDGRWAGAHCWLAFVNRLDHRTPGWTPVRFVLFDTLERNANAIKVMLPAVLEVPSVYIDHTLTRVRCLAQPHLVRAKALAALTGKPGAKPAPHLFASRIPVWSSRSRLPVQVRDHGLHGISARVTYDGGHFSADQPDAPLRHEPEAADAGGG